MVTYNWYSRKQRELKLPQEQKQNKYGKKMWAQKKHRGLQFQQIRIIVMYHFKFDKY